MCRRRTSQHMHHSFHYSLFIAQRELGAETWSASHKSLSKGALHYDIPPCVTGHCAETPAGVNDRAARRRSLPVVTKDSPSGNNPGFNHVRAARFKRDLGSRAGGFLGSAITIATGQQPRSALYNGPFIFPHFYFQVPQLRACGKTHWKAS